MNWILDNAPPRDGALAPALGVVFLDFPYIISPMLTLEARPRAAKDNLKNIRNEGAMPAVFYGKKEKSTPISVGQKDFIKVWKEAGESSVVSLKVPDGDLEALIQDVDVDPVTGVPRHADFYVFEKGQKIEVQIPIEFSGVAPAVKDLGGVLVKVLHEINIEAMPKDLPHNILVDVSSLSQIGSQLTAKDLKLPEGVILLEKAEEVVVLVDEPKKEEEEPVAPIDLSEIEVEKKGKEKDEGEEESGAGTEPVAEKKEDKSK